VLFPAPVADVIGDFHFDAKKHFPKGSRCFYPRDTLGDKIGAVVPAIIANKLYAHFLFPFRKKVAGHLRPAQFFSALHSRRKFVVQVGTD
jgi:hypothetical protein